MKTITDLQGRDTKCLPDTWVLLKGGEMPRLLSLFLVGTCAICFHLLHLPASLVQVLSFVFSRLFCTPVTPDYI